MDDVADEARLARRTIYLHFPNKESLVNATVLHAISRTQSAMREPLNQGTGLDSLRGMLLARIFVRLRYVGPYHHSIDDVNRTLWPHDSEEDQSFYAPEVRLLAAAIEKGIADGSIAEVDADMTAEILVRASNGFLPSNLTPAEVAHPEIVRKKLDTFVDMVTSGIAIRSNL